MSKSLVYEAVKNEFPSYKVINIFEVGFPIFKKQIKCLATVEKGLPIVLEFTLKLINLGYEIIEISEMLALEEGLISSAYFDLIQLELIDYKSRKITDKGREALFKSKYSNLEMVDLNINIDSYLGTIIKNHTFVKAKNTSKINLFTVKPLLLKEDASLIDYSKVRNVFKEMKKEEDPEFDGNLVEISKIISRPDEFKRLYLVVLKSIENESRILVYDLDFRIESMEQKIKQGDLQGIKFLNYDKKFLECVGKLDLDYKLKSEEVDYIDILGIEILESDYSRIEFILPISDDFIPNDAWINTLKRMLKSKSKVVIVFTGNYRNTYQKEQVDKLLKIANSSDFLEVKHTIEDKLPTLVINRKYGYIIKPFKHDLDLASNISCIGNKVYKIELMNSTVLLYQESNNTFERVLLNKYALNQKLKELIAYIKDLDLLMNDYYGSGWLINNRCNNEHLIEKLKLATNLDAFISFTAQLYGCIGEIVKDVGERHGIKGYFFGDFKTRVPDVQNALNRLRVYRNSVQHSHLDEKQVEIYLNFIKEDLNGSFPEFITKGYLKVQTIILDELLIGVKNEVSNIKKELLNI
ncbi:hypothetical protein [Peribacillus acanthi]|uniref:hypothetical protein n=1 Tax=Peribacillus acanthi TaxID=2171554 RepID=UPI000D3E0593|nr:hypothetical protein [Peribacillus acanthi]